MSRHKYHRKLRAVLAGAALVAQIHLFFVVELHHHAGLLELYGGSGQVAAHATQRQVSPGREVNCPACMVCRQGAIQIAASARLPFRPSAVLELPVTRARKYACLVPFGLSSRAPPLS